MARSSQSIIEARDGTRRAGLAVERSIGCGHRHVLNGSRLLDFSLQKPQLATDVTGLSHISTLRTDGSHVWSGTSPTAG